MRPPSPNTRRPHRDATTDQRREQWRRPDRCFGVVQPAPQQRNHSETVRRSRAAACTRPFSLLVRRTCTTLRLSLGTRRDYSGAIVSARSVILQEPTTAFQRSVRVSLLFEVDWRPEYMEKMGQELGEHFAVLRTELTEMAWRWQEFRELFENESRIELLNRTSPMFFWMVQQALLDEMLLALTRLTGAPISNGQKNLTIKRLADLLDNIQLRDEIRKKILDLDAAVKFANDWRHKVLAHCDLDTALQRRATPLPAVTTAKITKALGDCAAILDTIELHYTGAKTESTVFSAQGALSVLYALRSGVGWEEKVQRALEAGTYHPADWESFLPAI